MLLSGLLRRREEEGGGRDTRRLEARLARQRLLSLAFNGRKVFRGLAAGVTWLDLDAGEQRFLLAGGADGSVAVFDVLRPSFPDGAAPSGGAHAPGAFVGRAGGGSPAEHAPVLAAARGDARAHARGVAGACWYPVDSGMFATGGADGAVRLWDANAGAPVLDFGPPALAGRVAAVAWSPAGGAAGLVAAACAGAGGGGAGGGGGPPAVVLCDPASGGAAHALAVRGGAPALALAWSPRAEHELAAGGADGSLLLWDVRRAGPLAAFDAGDALGGGGGGGGGVGGRRRGAAAAGRSPPGSPGGAPGAGAPRHAAAHEGPVTGLAPTPDGLFWLSAGGDDALRLWCAARRADRLVHYPGAFNRARRPRQLATTPDGGAVFAPSGSAVRAYDVQSGAPLATLAGAHYDAVHACRWGAAAGELYTGGNDHAVVAWAPGGGGNGGESGGDDSDADAWSDP